MRKTKNKFLGLNQLYHFFDLIFLEETMWVKEKNILVKIVRKNRRVTRILYESRVL